MESSREAIDRAHPVGWVPREEAESRPSKQSYSGADRSRNGPLSCRGYSRTPGFLDMSERPIELEGVVSAQEVNTLPASEHQGLSYEAPTDPLAATNGINRDERRVRLQLAIAEQFGIRGMARPGSSPVWGQ